MTIKPIAIKVPHEPHAPFVVLRNFYVQAHFATQADAEAWLQRERDDVGAETFNRSAWTLWNTAPTPCVFPLYLHGNLSDAAGNVADH